MNKDVCMKKLIFVVLFLVAVPRAQADPTIFDVRKTLPMSDDETVYHDYYINGGPESGLTPGMIITVERHLPLYDTYRNHSAGDLQLKVAKIKIIHSQKGLSVGRLQSEFSRADAPLLEDNFIMVGDTLNLATATHEGKKTADSAPPSATPVAVTPEPTAPAPTAPATATPPAATPAASESKTVAQITVNSVALPPKPTQGAVSPPALQ
jgi:hypothetical protein